MNSLEELWNFVNSNLVGLIFAALLGSGLSLLIQRQQDESEEESLALMLGHEIAQDKLIARASIDETTKTLQTFKKDAQRGSYAFFSITQWDLFRTIYDKPTTNLSILPPKLIPVISDVYIHVEVCNHSKEVVNSQYEDGQQIVKELKGGNLEMKGDLDTAVTQFISFVEGYLKNLEAFIPRCDLALKELSDIAKIDESQVARIMSPVPSAVTGKTTP